MDKKVRGIIRNKMEVTRLIHFKKIMELEKNKWTRIAIENWILKKTLETLVTQTSGATTK